jgi:hypothetical protein
MKNNCMKFCYTIEIRLRMECKKAAGGQNSDFNSYSSNGILTFNCFCSVTLQTDRYICLFSHNSDNYLQQV